ncbi:NAD-dependent epimerase/dehydratase family protein [Sutcliffiella horikoshii]|uniref:NAD-dependent epimerase/dehydratase family protein n=1 Tax=Bacillaceae TaxID=186817 RepID=UPI0001E89727|nr:NAD-dependent epimerase/dehydratase family protein [Bacillus sp. m3-13]
MMKNAVVLGATTQVGFALCQYLIDKEVEVTGLVWSEKMDGKSEEMLMEIGRNAFFSSQSERFSNQSIDAVFYCLDEIDNVDEKEQKQYVDLAEHAKKLVFISSYGKFAWNREFRQQVMSKLSGSEDQSYCAIYLPMVYGPWQHEEESVHKRLLEELEQKESVPMAIKEQDVLFVEDVAEAIYNFLIRNENVKEVLFENDNSRALEELIKELNLTSLTIVEPEEVKKFTKYKVPQHHTIKEGIQAQRDQLNHRLKIE